MSLIFSPLQDVAPMDVDEHIYFINFILSEYGNDVSKFSAFIGDTVSVKRSIPAKTNVPMVGCTSHRLKLAFKHVLADKDKFLNKLNRLFVKLRGLLLSWVLRRFTRLRPKIHNATKCNSTFDPIKRYRQLLRFFDHLDSPEIDEISLTLSEFQKLDAIIDRLKVFENPSKEL